MLVSGRSGVGDVAKTAAFADMSADGQTIVFLSDQQLVAADEDTATDTYANLDGQVRLISDRVRSGLDGNVAARPSAISPDGRTAVFSTDEPLVDEDEDKSATDVYSSALDGSAAA